MTQNFNIVNLAHENKFIYIHSFLHPLKGMAIAPVPYERSTKFSPHEKGSHYFRTFPIVGEDWQVIDDEWENMDLDYGFDFAILDGKDKVIPLANRAYIGALNEGSDDIGRTCIALLREAKQMGITFSDDQYSRTIHLHVKKSYLDGCYRIGNTSEIEDELEAVGKSNHYPVPEVHFRFDGKDTPDARCCHIFTEDDLLFFLKRATGGYSDFFQRTSLRIRLHIPRSIPADVRKTLQAMARKVNAYLAFNDELNQYESQKLLPSC